MALPGAVVSSDPSKLSSGEGGRGRASPRLTSTVHSASTATAPWEFFYFFLKSLFFFLVSPVSVCICAQCVFTVTKAHFQTPTPVVTDTLRVPMAGLAFSHQVSPYWEEGDKSDGIFLF